MALTKVQTIGIETGITFTGITTTSSLQATEINVSGIATFGGNVSIAGTLTYEDVTDIDSVGLITARSGVNITDGGLVVVGVTTVSAGSASAPSISPSGDPDTGLYSPGADQLALATGGSGRLFVDSIGRVAIGTISYSGQLHVYAPSLGVTALFSANTDNAYDSSRLSLIGGNLSANEIYLGDGLDNDVGKITYNNDGNYLAFTANANERLRIDSSGRVGVGTAAPTNTLEVAGTATSNLFAVKATSSGDVVAITARGAGNGGIISGLNNAQNDYEPLEINGEFIYFQTRTGAGTVTERGRIDSSGRLLVGTITSPSLTDGQYAKIHLVGNTAGASGDAVLNLGRGILASSGMSAGTILGILQFTDSAGAAHATIKGVADAATGSNDYPGRLVFSTTANSAHSPTERMRIGSNGQASHFGDTTVITSASALSAGTAEYLFVGQHSATTINNGTDSIRITTNGNITNTNDSYGQISDIKLKENIVDAESQWDDFKAVRFRKFNFKEETGHETHTQLGVIAQELELVSPGLVYETPDQDEDGNDLGTTTKAVKSSVLVKKALVALQEAMERIETLETQNADLLTRVSALEG